MFHAAARRRYDAALCMYHDQALIPIKTIDFDGGVNVTLGLPFIRTSPDHGTAFDIAGKGVARARQPDRGAAARGRDGGDAPDPLRAAGLNPSSASALAALPPLREVIARHGIAARSAGSARISSSTST